MTDLLPLIPIAFAALLGAIALATRMTRKAGF